MLAWVGVATAAPNGQPSKPHPTHPHKTPTPTTSPEPTTPVPTVTRTQTLVAPSELLENPDFEGSYSGIAPSWSQNNWGGASPSYSRTTTNPHGGTSAQQIVVTGTVGDNDNGVVFYQEYALTAGTTYEASIWLRAPSPILVEFGLRRVDPFQEFVAVKSVLVGTEWQQVRVLGGFEEDVNTMGAINFLQTGTLIVDDACLTTAPRNDSVASSAPIPDRLFGQHINSWVYSPATWPVASEFEVSRLWDTGTRWRDIETSNGTFNWTRLDLYVDEAVDAGQEMIYTMGITPSWANGGDDSQPPTDIEDWRDYVQEIGNRYAGVIKYWEVWNEVDTGNFWTGTHAEMLELAEVAYDELKAIDPTNQILTPNVTSNGLKWLDQYLYQGGGDFADVISFHRGFDTTLTVERFEPLFRGLFDLVAAYGQGSKPVFNTEAQVLLAGTSDQQIGAVSRVYLLMWLWGISNVNWYAWDIYDDGGVTFYVQLSEPANKQVLTAAGTGYRETGRWLKGATMTGKTIDASGSWVLTLTRAGGYEGRVVWNPNGDTSFTIPAEWNVTRKRDLAASTTGQGAGTVTVGYKPLLFENQAP
jgi:hypothetical protein